MRVNVYAEEMTERTEIISKVIDGHQFTGLRLYLELPVTHQGQQISGPFMHHPNDDDSAAITFWGKRDLRTVLRKMLADLDAHYGGASAPSAEHESLTQAALDVLAERKRQIQAEGFTNERDDEYDPGELAAAATAYSLNAADQLRPKSQGDGGNAQPVMWPWDAKWWKPASPRHDLVKAAALALAEIERMDRHVAKGES